MNDSGTAVLEGANVTSALGIGAPKSQQQIRLLRVIRTLNPIDGGPIEAVKQITAVHAAEGHQAVVVSLDLPDDPWVKQSPLRVEALGPGGRGYGFGSRLVPWLRSHAGQFDGVIVSGLWQYQSLGVWRAMRGHETPYFVFPHGMLDPWFKTAYPLKHLKKWLYWPWAEYRVLRDARAVCFTSEEERRRARESFWLYRCREAVVNYGTAAPGGNAEEQQRKFFQTFPALQGKRLILFLGRIHEKKGCDLLLEAFHRVVSVHRDALADLRLVFAGPDQSGWQAELNARALSLGIAGQVIWTGMLTGDLKWGALRSAAAFALPSHQENFGVAVAEALACGMPVLISNKVNIWREIEADRAGFVASDDLEGTQQLIERWLALSNPEVLHVRANALACFLRRFEVCKAAQSLADLVRQSRPSLQRPRASVKWPG
jgi:glycosyltransferase involved in cell wall biosynthesis